MKASPNIKLLAAVLAAVTVMAIEAFAQGTNTTTVLFEVNVDALITASQEGEETVSLNATANETARLTLPLGSVSVSYYGAGQKLNAPLITGSRGNIALRLPPQSYESAEIALHSVNGRLIMRGKAAVSEAANVISRRNVAAGAYVLSVKGITGSAFTTCLTHSGGKLNINAAFGAESVPPARQLWKMAVADDWTIRVSAAEEGYNDTAYTLNTRKPYNQPQYITLYRVAADSTFTDRRDGKVYKKVKIGNQIWMAENLNYAASGSKCGNGRYLSDSNTESCNTYGRLYTLATAMNDPASSTAVSGGIRGVCPSGWHLPDNAEWDNLFRYADGTNGTESPYSSSTAGRYLKAKAGWNNCGPAGSGKTYLCEDTYGFSALPGGDGYSDGSFNYVGDYGGWWSAGEHNSNLAYHRNMNNNSESAGSSNRYEDGLFSVRCVED